MQHVFKQFPQSQFSKRIIRFLSSYQRVSLIIICFGILVRLVQYLFNRSLWADEAVLALNIVNRSYLELLQPLDYEQGAPFGFLIVLKLAVQVFGDNEYALRLFPILSSIISFFLFYKLALQCIQRPAIPIALALFASLRYLVYYASEVKQYSTDVAIALLSCLIAMHLRKPRLDIGQIVTLCIVGALTIWFSHPAVFVLAGVGITSLVSGLLKRERLKLISILVIYSTWVLSFAVFYFLSLRDLGSNGDLLKSWQNKDAFPSSNFDIIWLLDSFGKFFHNPLGFNGPMDGLAIIAFLAGCISCFYRKKEALFVLLSPLFVTFFAAALHKYPFSNRLVLFLTPFIILLIAEGAVYITNKTRSKPIALVGNLLIALLLTQPLVRASNLLVKPYLREEIKPVISYVKAHQQPKDILYIYQRGEHQFKYYASKYGYRDGDYIIGVDDLDKVDGKKVSAEEWERYRSDLNKLRGNKRVWLIFSHAYLWKENKMIQSYLDSIGKRIDFFENPGSFVYLYDLS
jgi:hypothetical protein